MNVEPQVLWWLDVSGLILNFLGGLFLTYDLLTETSKAVAEQETNKLKGEGQIHEMAVRSYTLTLERPDLPDDLRAKYQAELDKENAAFEKVKKEMEGRITHLSGHGDRAVALGLIGIIAIVIGFLLQLVKVLLSSA